MKFFIPLAEDDAQAARVYDAIKQFAATQTGWRVEDRRIARLQYRHERKDYDAVVGGREQRTGETIIAILETSEAYLICTPNRGVERGVPIQVNPNFENSVTYFDGEVS